jgi:hypothetical protein
MPEPTTTRQLARLAAVLLSRLDVDRSNPTIQAELQEVRRHLAAALAGVARLAARSIEQERAA